FAPSLQRGEEILAVFSGAENEGGGLELRRLQRAFREHRIVAIAHHQGFGLELPVAESALTPGFFRHWSGSRRRFSTLVWRISRTARREGRFCPCASRLASGAAQINQCAAASEGRGVLCARESSAAPGGPLAAGARAISAPKAARSEPRRSSPPG